MATRVVVPGTVTAGVLPVSAINNLPGGWIGYAQLTGDSNSWNDTATAITGLSLTVTVNTNRRISVEAFGQIDYGVAAGVGDLFLFEGAFAYRKYRYGGGNGLAQAEISMKVFLTPTAGSHTYFLKGDRVTGTNTHHVAASTDGGNGPGPFWFGVFDHGPAS